MGDGFNDFVTIIHVRLSIENRDQGRLHNIKNFVTSIMDNPLVNMIKCTVAQFT